MPTRRATNSSTATWSPLATTTGRAAVRHGPSRCRTALIGATTMPGCLDPTPTVPVPPPSCHSNRSRRPMVATSGLTRSKGKVSHAGNTSTSIGPSLVDGSLPPPSVKASRSWASWSAATPVEVTTNTGRRLPSRMSPANTNAWAGVATARVALGAPMTRGMAGSLRNKGGSERRLTCSGYRAPAQAMPGPGWGERRGGTRPIGHRSPREGPVQRRLGSQRNRRAVKSRPATAQINMTTRS